MALYFTNGVSVLSLRTNDLRRYKCHLKREARVAKLLAGASRKA